MKIKKDNTLALKLDSELERAILARCARDRISKSALIRQVMSRELEKELTQNLVAVTE